MQRLLLSIAKIFIGLGYLHDMSCMSEKPIISVKEYDASAKKKLKQSIVLRKMKIAIKKANSCGELIQPLKTLLQLTVRTTDTIDWEMAKDTEITYLTKYCTQQYAIPSQSPSKQLKDLWNYYCRLAFLSLSEDPQDFIQAVEIFTVWDTDIGSIKAAQFMRNWESSPDNDKLNLNLVTIKAAAINHCDILFEMPMQKALVDSFYQMLKINQI